jgi:hypothetical protein
MNERDTKEMEKIRHGGERFLKLGCKERGGFFRVAVRRRHRVEDSEGSDSIDKAVDSSMLDSSLVCS